MPNIDLNFKAEQALGKFLPTVYLKRAFVSYNETAVNPAEQDFLKISVQLEIILTKPDDLGYGEGLEASEPRDIEGMSVENFIKLYLNDLYLYTFISPFQTLNTNLENNSLYMKDLFEAIEALDMPTRDNFTSDSPLWPMIKHIAHDQFLSPKDHGISYAFDFTANGGTYDKFELDMDDFLGPGRMILGVDSTALMALSLKNTDLLTGFIFEKAQTYTDSGHGIDSTSGTQLQAIFYGPEGVNGPWNKPDSITWDYLYAAANVDAARAHTIASWNNPKKSAGSFKVDNWDSYLSTFSGEDPSTAALAHKTENSFLYEVLPDILSEEAPNARLFSMWNKYRLSDLIDWEVYDGKEHLIFNKRYDEDEKEIFTISNINLDFVMNESFASWGEAKSNPQYVDDILRALEKVFIISTIGLDVDKRIDSLLTNDYETIPKELFNNFFGSITYEHVLSNNVVPNPYYEYYVFSDSKSPYRGTPIQGLNGKLYAGDPYSLEEVVKQYNKLIKKWASSDAAADKRVSKHLKNLKLILSKYKKSSSLVREIKFFQRTFVDKLPSTPAGQFYSEFVALMSRINKKIMMQQPVEKRIGVSGTCIDIRPPRVISTTYTPPNPNEAHEGPGQKYSTDPTRNRVDSPFIPQGMGKVFRELRFQDVDSPTGSSEAEDYRDSLIASTMAAHGATTGVTEDMIIAAVNARMLEIFGDGVPDSDPDGAGSAVAETSSLLLDMIVKNHGYFFFDWEKALHQTSTLAHIVDLPKLGVFFNAYVPYTYFRVKSVTMRRKELNIDFHPTDEWLSEAEAGLSAGDAPIHEMVMKTSLDSTTPFPENLVTEHWVTDSDHKYGMPYTETGGYTFIDGTLEMPTGRDYSHVRYVHFDVQSGDQSEWGPGGLTKFQLLGGNTILGEKGFGGPSVDMTGRGYSLLGLLKSYRCMGFEFVDYMDDDVALANTGGLNKYLDYHSGDALRSEGIRRHLIGQHLNPYGENETHYDIEIEIEDTTMQFFDTIYEAFIEPLIVAWEEYLAYAEELCSFNQSTEQFNTFFVEAMEEKYVNSKHINEIDFNTLLAALLGYADPDDPDSDALTDLEGAHDAERTFDLGESIASNLSFDQAAKELPPWVSAAYLSAVIKEIFFNPTPRGQLVQVKSSLTNAFSTVRDSIRSGVIDPEVTKFLAEMYSISPQKGSIEALRAFDTRIQPLIELFRYNNSTMVTELGIQFGEELDFVEGAAIRSHIKNNSVRRLFFSSLKIDTPIAVGADRESFFFASPASETTVPAEVYPYVPTLEAGTRMYAGPFPVSEPPNFRMLELRTPELLYFRTFAPKHLADYERIFAHIADLPDFISWQRRHIMMGDDRFDRTLHPEDIDPYRVADEGGDTRFRIYLPYDDCDPRVVGTDKTMRSYWEVLETMSDEAGHPIPRTVRLMWYKEFPGGGGATHAGVDSGVTEY